MLEAVQQMVDHNYWARDRQLEACATLTPDEFLRPLGASFSSVRDTLAHMVGVEWLWLERGQGRSPGGLPPAEEFPTLSEVTRRWTAVERDQRAFLAGLSEERLALPSSYANFKGETWSYPLWSAFFHVFNHQSYHRGQVTMLLRRLGKQAVQVDFLLGYDFGFRPNEIQGRICTMRKSGGGNDHVAR